MTTNIHYHQDGTHRIMSVDGEYNHETVAKILKDNDIAMDDDRFLLTYKQTKTQEINND